MPSIYMHTLNGRPAFFDGTQVCYVGRTAPAKQALVSSLAKIRDQQRRSALWCEKHGLGVTGGYGYIRLSKAGAPYAD